MAKSWTRSVRIAMSRARRIEAGDSSGDSRSSLVSTLSRIGWELHTRMVFKTQKEQINSEFELRKLQNHLNPQTLAKT
eukprot:1970543-Amphidinium_carterae.1